MARGQALLIGLGNHTSRILHQWLQHSGVQLFASCFGLEDVAEQGLDGGAVCAVHKVRNPSVNTIDLAVKLCLLLLAQDGCSSVTLVSIDYTGALLQFLCFEPYQDCQHR